MAAHPFADAPGPLRSLNIAPVAALPADLATEAVIGRKGVELVSGLWLGREIAERATLLELDVASPTLLRDFAARLGKAEPRTPAHDAARDIARRFGVRLASLLVMLARGEPANRLARPNWGDEQWAFWAAVRRVVIGGGVMAGAIGDVALPEAQAVLDAHSVDIRLVRSPWADRIVLVGLARHAPIVARWRAVLDFGQTAVKLGVAEYDDGSLVRLRVLPGRPGVCRSAIGLSSDRAEIAAEWEAILDAIVAAANEARTLSQGVSDVVVSLACYFRDSEPDPDEVRSCYGRLQLLGPDLRGRMRTDLTRRLRSDVEITLIHDGDAAALAVDPDETTVVLTVGTAMGLGFPLARDTRAPLATRFLLA